MKVRVTLKSGRVIKVRVPPIQNEEMEKIEQYIGTNRPKNFLLCRGSKTKAVIHGDEIAAVEFR